MLSCRGVGSADLAVGQSTLWNVTQITSFGVDPSQRSLLQQVLGLINLKAHRGLACG